MDEDQVAALGIQHVALEIGREELERARRFWLLAGFEAVDPPPGLRGRAIWMEAGPAGARTQVHLLHSEAGEADGVGGAGEAAETPAPAAGHVAVVAPSFGATVSALRRAGFPVVDRRPHWGAARAFAEHPGGHTVELMAAPPPARAGGSTS